jgi:hypothetical protein
MFLISLYGARRAVDVSGRPARELSRERAARCQRDGQVLWRTPRLRTWLVGGGSGPDTNGAHERFGLAFEAAPAHAWQPK